MQPRRNAARREVRDHCVCELVGEYAIELLQVLARAFHGDANPAVEDPAGPFRRTREIAKLLLGVKRDGDRVGGVGANRFADAPIGRVEARDGTISQLAVGAALEDDRKAAVVALRQSAVNAGLLSPGVQPLSHLEVAWPLTHRLLVRSNRVVDISGAVLNLAEELRGVRQPGAQLQRSFERTHRVVFSTEDVRGNARAEMQQALTGMELERLTEDRCGALSIAALYRRPSLFPGLTRSVRLRSRRQRHDHREQQRQSGAFDHETGVKKIIGRRLCLVTWIPVSPGSRKCNLRQDTWGGI